MLCGLVFCGRAQIGALKSGEATFANTLGALSNVHRELAPLVNNVIFPSNVSPDKEMRGKSSEAEVMIEKAIVEAEMRVDVYESVMDFMNRCGNELEGEDKRLADKAVRSFKRNGLMLSEEKRAKLADIKKRLAELSTEAQHNLGEENTTHEFTREQLDGLPKSFIDGLAKSPSDDTKLVVYAKARVRAVA